MAKKVKSHVSFLSLYLLTIHAQFTQSYISINPSLENRVLNGNREQFQIKIDVDEESQEETDEKLLSGNENNAQIPNTLKRRIRSLSSQFKPEKTMYTFNDSHYYAKVHWSGSNSSTILVLMSHPKSMSSSEKPSYFYISRDYGKTFENRTNDFILPNKTHAVVTDFFSSSKDNKRYIFVSKYHKYIFQTNDEWNTFTRVAVPFIPVEAKYHPNRPYYVMAWEKDEGNGMLYASTNNGKSWSFKAARVKNYYWGWLPPFDTGSTLYFQREGWFGAGGYVQKATPWRPIFSFTETVAYNVLDFKLIDQYMFAVKNGSDQRYRRLQVSVNRRPFQNTSFPFNNATSYIVVDASENETMIAVSHDNWANLYISNRQALRYSLSLTNLVYYNEGDGVKHKFFEHNFVDMHKVDGISGIYIATCQRHKELHSFITFDKGGEWSPLRPPPGTVCNTTECYLHVSQEFGYHSPFTRYTPIYSKKSAPGFILATGNVGDSMNGYPNVYFSRDAGLNWKQLFTGHFYYGFVDHGGVIVVVPKYGLVDELRYSYNEGNTWNTYQFTDKPMKVYGLLTEPGEKTTIFTLFGSKPRQHSWIIIQVDMRNVLGSPCKADSDYKLWEVTDTRNDTQHCLLGKKQVYERRDPNSRCFNGYNYDRPKLALPCLCTRDDYMCDFGYSLASWRGWFLRTCSPDQDYIITDSKPPDWCRPGLTYNVTKGYRIVPGDECVDGVKKYYDPKIYTCPIKNITDYVFYSTRTALHRYDMLLKQSVEFNLGDMENVISIDVDYKSNVLFFADIFYDEIVMMNLNSGKVTTLLKQNNSQVHIEGLAFDWYTHNLYYCDGGLAEIAIINVDGKHRKRLIGPSSLQKPRALIVHPAAGTMYWTDWGNNAQIGKANMDGSGVTTLINHNIRWPNGITIDFGSGRLFWTDAGHDRIESCDLNGRNRKVLATETPHPYAVSIYKNTLIWDDWQKHAVYKMSKRGDSEPEEVVSDVTNAMDLKAYWPDKQKEGRNTCEGKCSVICLLKGKDDYTCTCPDNLLDDGKEGCKCPDGQKYEDGECKTEGACLANQFKCKSGECIPLSWQCDEDSDCDDGSDETEDVCHGQGCNREQLTCDNGRCLSKTWKCDGDNDCGDGSDERNCDTECEKDGKHVRCPNKRCISKTWLCDGDNDCSDYWDERNCRNYTTLPPFTLPPTPGKCPSSQFACKNGYCISDEMRCDRVNNCGDNSDEQDCHVTDRPFTRPPIPLTCPQGWAFCADRSMCFNKADKCDTFPDCRDGSDEVGCPKECKEFKCGSGECIPDSKVCDGNQDCKNGDDEKTCNKKPTEWCFPFPWGFNCTRPDGHCYLHDQMCDGKVLCEDYSDEDKNVCGVTDRVKELKWEVEGTSVILKWKHANVMLGDADGYFIAYIEETGKRAEVSIDLVDTYTVKNLRACRTYYFAVALRHKKLPKSKWLFTSSNGIETEGRGEPQGAYDIRVSQPSVSWNEDGGRCFNDYEVNTRWVICEQGNQTIILYNVGPVLHDAGTLLIERGGVKDKVYTCHIIVSYETYGQSDVNKTSIPFKFQLGRTSNAPDHGKRTDNKDKKKANALVWAIPVAVVVLALFAMLVVMLVKYRRLQHSFLAFAARGSYVRQDDDFDEDDPGNMVVGFHAGEDAPMINRFSDDEPLVVG